MLHLIDPKHLKIDHKIKPVENIKIDNNNNKYIYIIIFICIIFYFFYYIKVTEIKDPDLSCLPKNMD